MCAWQLLFLPMLEPNVIAFGGSNQVYVNTCSKAMLANTCVVQHMLMGSIGKRICEKWVWNTLKAKLQTCEQKRNGSLKLYIRELNHLLGHG